MLEECQGNLELAAKKLGTCYHTLHRWSKKYPEVQKAIEDSKQTIAEKVKNTIVGQALNGQLTAAIYYSKAQMGWSDRQIVEHRGLGFNVSTTTDESTLADESRPTLRVVDGGGPPEPTTPEDQRDSLEEDSEGTLKGSHGCSK